MGTRSKIEIASLRKQFGDLVVLKDINLSVEQGQVVALIGPSGSGKSTLLRCINLLVTPNGGQVRVGADSFTFGAGTKLPGTRELARFRAGTGMVFQHFNLFPHMTALGNVMEAPVTVRGTPKAQAREKAMALLAKVGLTDKADEYPSRLSGGQKQRVAIARALTMEPRVLLFDEPTSALDPTLVGEVIMVMEELAHEGSTMIIVTHEMAFAREAADRVYFIEEGTFIEVGSPEQVLDHPQDERTRRFLRRLLSSGVSV